MKKLTINSITCKEKTNGPGHDDVFFMVQVDGGPPIRYPVDGTWQMDDSDDNHVSFPTGDATDKPEFAYTYNCYVSVWDHDGPLNWINEADMLGNAFFDADAGSGDVDIWGVDSSRYQLNVNVSDVNPANSSQDTPVSESLQESIKQELQAWSESDAGQKALGTDDEDDLVDAFTDALENAFQRTVQAAGELPWIESISIGISAQVEVFGGIQGDFGVVMGLDGFPNDWAIYAGGALVEGFEAGISAAFSVGVWSQKPEDVGGFYEGIEVEVTDVAGVNGAIWVGRGDKEKLLSDGFKLSTTLKLAKAVFLGLDIGIDDGVSAEELYIIAGHLERYPTFQTGSYDNMVVLTDLVCNDKHSSGGGHDDVWLHWKVDGKAQAYQYPIWNAFEMDDDDDDHWQCGTIIKFNDQFDLTLYAKSSDTKEMDEDEDDNKARFDVGDFGNRVGGGTSFTFHDGGTEYTLSMKLLKMG